MKQFNVVTAPIGQSDKRENIEVTDDFAGIMEACATALAGPTQHVEGRGLLTDIGLDAYDAFHPGAQPINQAFVAARIFVEQNYRLVHASNKETSRTVIYSPDRDSRVRQLQVKYLPTKPAVYARRFVLTLGVAYQDLVALNTVAMSAPLLHFLLNLRTMLGK